MIEPVLIPAQPEAALRGPPEALPRGRLGGGPGPVPGEPQRHPGPLPGAGVAQLRRGLGRGAGHHVDLEHAQAQPAALLQQQPQPAGEQPAGVARRGEGRRREELLRERWERGRVLDGSRGAVGPADRVAAEGEGQRRQVQADVRCGLLPAGGEREEEQAVQDVRVVREEEELAEHRDGCYAVGGNCHGGFCDARDANNTHIIHTSLTLNKRKLS